MDVFLRHFCHRTIKRHQDVLIPLYRLRSALSRLWQTISIHPSFAFQNQEWLMVIHETITSISRKLLNRNHDLHFMNWLKNSRVHL